MSASATSSKFKKALPFLPLPISLLSYLIVFPLAAWNHNMFFLLAAVLVPLLLAQVMQVRAGRRAFTGVFTAKTGIRMLVVAVMGFLLWHHLWLLAILLLIAELVINNRALKNK